MKNIMNIPKTRILIYKTLQKFHNTHQEGGRKVVYASLQPTGTPHVGNWFGTIQPWLRWQEQPDTLCVFTINDRHALNLGMSHKDIRFNVHKTAACLLAAGLDPQRSILVLQSQMPNMLRWILWSMTYREDTDKPFVKMKNLNNGLRSYLVFEAANILLYRSTHVLVGSSHVPLLQECQRLAELFNDQYGLVFPVPTPCLESGAAANVFSLRNPAKKMSKTDPDERSRVLLLDTEEEIVAKMRKAITDCISQVKFDPINRPGVSNLISLHSLASGQPIAELCQEAVGQDTGQYKLTVAKAMAHHLKPLQHKGQQILSEPHKLDQILQDGSLRAAQVAGHTLQLARSARGLYCGNSQPLPSQPPPVNSCNLPKVSRVIFSGIQPTGGLPHLGNLFGAVDLWLHLQDQPDSRCLFSIVDLHAITQAHSPRELRKNIFMMAASLLAFGLDPNKCILFLQSQVPQHEELFSLLWPFTTEARVSRLPQYKEKVSGLARIPNGLHAYPVLQAADILLYRATEVPIGEDQVQHLQLCQDICQNINKMCGEEVLPLPQIVLSQLPRLKSLSDPAKKMSKSDPDPQSRIELTDSPDQIHSKILQSRTGEDKQGLANLMAIHRLAGRTSQADVELQASRLELPSYKSQVAEAVIERLRPCQQRLQQLLDDPHHVEQTLADGADRAMALAQDTLNILHKALHK